MPKPLLRCCGAFMHSFGDCSAGEIGVVAPVAILKEEDDFRLISSKSGAENKAFHVNSHMTSLK